MTDFNLVDHDWIPAIVEGRQRDVSLREALRSAETIDLSLAQPLETVATLRQVLIPVVLRACGAPRDISAWHAMFRGPDLGTLTAYLDSVQHRFNLFDKDCPFAQVADLEAVSGLTKPSSLLRADLATGNNVPLFTERTEATPPPLSAAQAARALIVTQCFDTAAIKTGAVGDSQVKQGKTTGNPTGPVGTLGVVIPWGRSLWETLVLNLPIIPAGLRPFDRPQWEDLPSDATWTTREPRGLLDLLTWQSRRIRLIREVLGGTSAVTRVVVCAGDRLPRTPPDLEIHSLWQPADVKRTGVSQKPRRHQPGRAAWRGLTSLLAVEADSSLLLAQLQVAEMKGALPPGLTPEVVTVGVVYGNQSAVVEDVLMDSIPLPVQALREGSRTRRAVFDAVEKADQVRSAANHLHDDVRRAAGAEPIPWDKGSRWGDVLMADLDAPTRRFLRGLQVSPDDSDSLLDEWADAVHSQAVDIAQSLQESAPPTTFLGREHRKRTYRLATSVSWYHYRLRQILKEQEIAGSTHE